jgi:FkbM family methyltransferase
VWDVGANIGLYTQKFLKVVGVSGQVIAIEPAPFSAKLCKDIAGKDIGGSNLLVVESALGSKEGIAKLEVSDEYPTASTNRISSNTDRNTVSVPILTGDSLALKLGSFPNLIKIDVEGFEVEVLKGMTEVLHSPSLKAIFIEVHFKLLEERGDKFGVQTIINILEECQFKVKWIDFSHIMGTRS